MAGAVKSWSRRQPARSLWDKEAPTRVREIGGPGPGSTRAEPVPGLRLQEPPSLTPGRGRGVQPEVSTEMRRASPWVLGGARKAERQASISWEGASGQCGEARSPMPCPSTSPKAAEPTCRGTQEALRGLEATTTLVSSPQRVLSKRMFYKVTCGCSEASSCGELVLEAG